MSGSRLGGATSWDISVVRPSPNDAPANGAVEPLAPHIHYAHPLFATFEVNWSAAFGGMPPDEFAKAALAAGTARPVSLPPPSPQPQPHP